MPLTRKKVGQRKKPAPKNQKPSETPVVEPTTEEEATGASKQEDSGDIVIELQVSETAVSEHKAAEDTERDIEDDSLIDTELVDDIGDIIDEHEDESLIDTEIDNMAETDEVGVIAGVEGEEEGDEERDGDMPVDFEIQEADGAYVSDIEEAEADSIDAPDTKLEEIDTADAGNKKIEENKGETTDDKKEEIENANATDVKMEEHEKTDAADVKIEEMDEITVDRVNEESDTYAMEEDNQLEDSYEGPDDSKHDADYEGEEEVDDEVKDEEKEGLHDEEEEKTKHETESHDDHEDGKEEEDVAEPLPESDVNYIDEKFKNPPFPESLSKLQKLTVTIGPIQQGDLLSKKLHEILRMIMNFEIKFEGKERFDNQGTSKRSEKLGYVRTQFKIKTPQYLVQMATLLGNLNIRGRDMSVKFPEVFNTAVKDCKEYLEKNKDIILKNHKARIEYLIGLKKRRIVVYNIPENTSEETMKALFPECLTVSIREEEIGNKKTCSAMLTFETEKVCTECFENNKDVEIGDSKVIIKRMLDPTVKKRRPFPFNPRGRGGIRGRGGPFRGLRSPIRGGIGQMGRRPPIGIRSNLKPSGPGMGFARGRGRFESTRGRGSPNVGIQRKEPMVKEPRRRTDSGPSPKQSRFSAERRSLDSDMGPAKSKRPNMQRMEDRGGQFQRKDPPRENRPRFKGNPGRSQRGGHNMQARNISPGQFSQGGMQQGGGMMRDQQFNQTQQRNLQMQGSRNTGGRDDDDPMAMMMYLKNTIAKMEEKITQRSIDGSSSSGGLSDYSMPTGRKRRGGMVDHNRSPKRQHFQDRDRRDSFGDRGQGSGFQGSNQDYDFGGNNSGYHDNTGYGGNNYRGNTSYGNDGGNTGMNTGGYGRGDRQQGNRGRRFSGNQGNRKNYNQQSSGNQGNRNNYNQQTGGNQGNRNNHNQQSGGNQGNRNHYNQQFGGNQGNRDNYNQQSGGRYGGGGMW